ncbi:MAG: hypothetical protein COY39_04655 [Alphaproteobacteria bacterium CG_4_10_14_0_8_um_filter_37_21]|nr:MAG: hypothetical protein COY39_04655 [Alphaproteobacteria bacterium CG_4_10_14_0_8_um_filter_37_21]
MLNNTYFFILLSFIIFLYVGYRKIWPDISKILREDIAKIKKQFNIVETKKLDLQNELELVVSNHAIFKDDLKKIHETSLEHAENIKNVYIKDMEILSQNHLSQIDTTYSNMVQRFENESLQYFSKVLTTDLRLFFEKQKNNNVFHRDILQKSLILLQK